MLTIPTSITEHPKRCNTGENLNYLAFSNLSHGEKPSNLSYGEKTTNEGESSMRSPVRPSSFVSVN